MTQEVFVSFDYDNDARLKDLLIGQARNPDSPFEVADWSIKTASAGWRAEARSRIRRSDQVIVLCGQHTWSAAGISIEIELARQEGTPYFLLQGYSAACKRPATALPTDKMYKWTWDNLKLLIAGAR